MQFFALCEGRLIRAEQARKGSDYVCPECRATLRLRDGGQRTPHFFHIESSPFCEQHTKSMEHIQTQLHIIDSLPRGEATMEQGFHSIGRIADVAWMNQRIVFEVQCSYIKPLEALARNKDYASIGFRVIWILHDKRYNKKIAPVAEILLREQGAYFTNIDADRRGIIYDQFEIFDLQRRIHKERPIPLNLRYPLLKHPRKSKIELPLTLDKRLEKWPLLFAGDLASQCISSRPPRSSITQLIRIEDRYTKRPPPLRPLRKLRQLYSLFFYYLLRTL